MILNVYPTEYSIINVRLSVIGIVMSMVALAFKERRKIMATTRAKARPIQRLSVTLRMESFTKSACM
jgi:hypothetical protein